MKIGIVITTALLTLLILALPETKMAQAASNATSNRSNELHKKPREAGVSDENARMGMYSAVMAESSSTNGQIEQARVYAENAPTYLQNPDDYFEFYAKGAAYVVLEKYDMALANFTQAIQHDQEKISAYIRRGRLYSQR